MMAIAIGGLSFITAAVALLGNADVAGYRADRAAFPTRCHRCGP